MRQGPQGIPPRIGAITMMNKKLTLYGLQKHNYLKRVKLELIGFAIGNFIMLNEIKTLIPLLPLPHQ